MILVLDLSLDAVSIQNFKNFEFCVNGPKINHAPDEIFSTTSKAISRRLTKKQAILVFSKNNVGSHYLVSGVLCLSQRCNFKWGWFR